MQGQQTRAKCRCCGMLLTSQNAWKQPTEMGGGLGAYCDTCMGRYYQFLSKTVGYKAAMYLACAAFNVPYLPQELENAKRYAKVRGVFPGYLAALRAAKYNEKDACGFREGVFSIKEVFGGELPQLELTDSDGQNVETGIEDVREMFGPGPENDPYTGDDYDALSKAYNALTCDRPYLSKQSELVIQDICKWTLERDKCMAKKEYADAQKIQGMIDKAKESESLRKKDELPQDRVRLDDIVLAVQRAGLPIMDYDELCKELANRAFHKRYPYTRDAADQMLLKIRNATAWNESRGEVDRLEPEFAIQDDLGEFSTKQDQTERKIYKQLGLYPLNMDGGKNAAP